LDLPDYLAPSSNTFGALQNSILSSDVFLLPVDFMINGSVILWISISLKNVCGISQAEEENNAIL